MSRKKSPRAKGASASSSSAAASSSAPSAALPAAQPPQRQAAGHAGAEAAAAANGVAPPGRPSLSSSGEFYDVAFKVMLVGDSGVGKTCLLVRFKDGAFLAGSFISTVGIDFRNKVLNVDGVKVKLQIWDTAGQERFRSVTHAYYRDAHALLLLYDVTNRASFDNMQAWLTEIQEYAKQDVVLMLLGNKVDSTQERVVKREDGEKLAKEYGVPFMETSAKSGLNVDLAFTAIAKELKHRAMKLPNEPRFKLHDYVKKEVKGAGCCRS
ncbi:ras-related protein Rab-26 [Eublepharis macularius]|uniref:small monomeric GTPase n=1 Tax=Eublepharis macularius TaxID=481883 RepID=A0AA97L9N1_EUBMA|nr:ras-related protein Rab-26 [Eublepharis macularius]